MQFELLFIGRDMPIDHKKDVSRATSMPRDLFNKMNFFVVLQQKLYKLN